MTYRNNWNNNAFILLLILKTHLTRILQKLLTREHKPGTNGNVGCMVKHHAKTTGHSRHPNCASSLETALKALSRVITFIPRTLLMKEHPSKEFMHHWFPPWGAMNIDVFAIYLHNDSVTDLQSTGFSRKKTTKGGQKFSFHTFRSV